MNDVISIRELEVHYRVGVPDEERSSPQRLLLTVDMFSDFSAAAGTDDLRKTIDYDAVSQRLLRFGEARSWKLIEKLAVDIAEMILSDFAAKRVAVEVEKFVVPKTRSVAVKITRP